MFVLLLVTVSLAEVWPLFTRCRSDRDCPVGGYCFKDECPHCLCPRGHSVINYVKDLRVIKVCAKEPVVNVGDQCPRPPLFCPDGSHCDDITSTCQCNEHLLVDQSQMFCRPAIFGEVCSQHSPCSESLGLVCTGSPPLCQCMTSLKAPDKWANHITKKWAFDRVDAIVQQCVIRSVGKSCTSDEHCASIGGSGAICAACGLCQCQQEGHMPSLLGHRCGVPLLLGDRCSHRMEAVCDGTRGLQCGHMCDFYKDSLEKVQKCHCSQMHVQDGEICKPKRKGKKCSTDLDCYLLKGGYGVCENRRCTVTGNNTAFRPHRVNRKCQKVNSDNTVNTLTSKWPLQPEASLLTTTASSRLPQMSSTAKLKHFLVTIVPSPSSSPHDVFNTTATYNKHHYQRHSNTPQHRTEFVYIDDIYNDTNSSNLEIVSQGRYTSSALRQLQSAFVWLGLCCMLCIFLV